MDNHTFLHILKEYTSITADEAMSINQELRAYPYSQILHSLAARNAQVNNSKGREAALHLAAVYATDRSVLKHIITQPVTRRPVSPISASMLQQETDFRKDDELVNQVLFDLEQLKKSKKGFEVLVEQMENNHTAHTWPKPEPSTKSKGKAVRLKADPEKIQTDPFTEGIIDEIKSTKRKIKPKDPKQKEQIEIIDQFIKAQPNIGKSKQSSPPEPSDLAEKSVSMSDQIVSETLVEILIKQGKKDKAVEVLRKLIWKFPQKKAYFAAQIEELKR